MERLTDRRRLALKLVTGDVSAASATRFAREAEIGARIRHPHVVPIVDVGISRGAPRRKCFGDVARARAILLQIADGLAALHDGGVVHRDLKPANVLLSGADESGLVAKIADFGISRGGECVVDAAAATVETPVARAKVTTTGMMLGTPQYMAPEASRGGGRAQIPADVFALGVVADEALSGRAPFAVPPVLLTLARAHLPRTARRSRLGGRLGAGSRVAGDRWEASFELGRANEGCSIRAALDLGKDPAPLLIGAWMVTVLDGPEAPIALCVDECVDFGLDGGAIHARFYQLMRSGARTSESQREANRAAEAAGKEVVEDRRSKRSRRIPGHEFTRGSCHALHMGWARRCRKRRGVSREHDALFDAWTSKVATTARRSG